MNMRVLFYENYFMLNHEDVQHMHIKHRVPNSQFKTDISEFGHLTIDGYRFDIFRVFPNRGITEIYEYIRPMMDSYIGIPTKINDTNVRVSFVNWCQFTEFYDITNDSSFAFINRLNSLRETAENPEAEEYAVAAKMTIHDIRRSISEIQESDLPVEDWTQEEISMFERHILMGLPVSIRQALQLLDDNILQESTAEYIKNSIISQMEHDPRAICNDEEWDIEHEEYLRELNALEESSPRNTLFQYLSTDTQIMDEFGACFTPNGIAYSNRCYLRVMA